MVSFKSYNINKYRNNAKPKPILVDYAKMVDNDY